VFYDLHYGLSRKFGRDSTTRSLSMRINLAD
jgi:hypothetical protein